MGQVGIYSFVEASGERYVGRFVDLARRLTEHILSSKIPRNALVQVDIELLTALGDAAEDALPIAEQLVIDGCGGAKSSGGSPADRINAIAKKRWEPLKQVDTDIDLAKSLLWP